MKKRLVGTSGAGTSRAVPVQLATHLRCAHVRYFSLLLCTLSSLRVDKMVIPLGTPSIPYCIYHESRLQAVYLRSKTSCRKTDRAYVWQAGGVETQCGDRFRLHIGLLVQI